MARKKRGREHAFWKRQSREKPPLPKKAPDQKTPSTNAERMLHPLISRAEGKADRAKMGHLESTIDSRGGEMRRESYSAGGRVHLRATTRDAKIEKKRR